MCLKDTNSYWRRHELTTNGLENIGENLNGGGGGGGGNGTPLCMSEG